MLEFVLFMFAGLVAMAYAYWGGPEDHVVTDRIRRVRFGGGIGMIAGLIYGFFSLPSTDVTPPFTPMPLDVSMLCAGIMMFGIGTAAVTFAFFVGKHVTTT